MPPDVTDGDAQPPGQSESDVNADTQKIAQAEAELKENRERPDHPGQAAP